MNKLLFVVNFKLLGPTDYSYEEGGETFKKVPTILIFETFGDVRATKYGDHYSDLPPTLVS